MTTHTDTGTDADLARVDADTFSDACVRAYNLCSIAEKPVTICARINANVLGFDVMFSDTYAHLRESGLAHRMIAPVAIFTPTGPAAPSREGEVRRAPTTERYLAPFDELLAQRAKGEA